jgi:hypothetical protein
MPVHEDDVDHLITHVTRSDASGRARPAKHFLLDQRHVDQLCLLDRILSSNEIEPGTLAATEIHPE